MLGRSVLIALGLTTLGAAHAAAAPDTGLAPCQRLATAARGLAQDAWNGGFGALKPQLAGASQVG